MNEYMDDLDDELGDFDAGGSTNSDNEKVDSILIKKILSEMKSEFNRSTYKVSRENTKEDSGAEDEEEEEEEVVEESKSKVEVPVEEEEESEEEQEEEEKVQEASPIPEKVEDDKQGNNELNEEESSEVPEKVSEKVAENDQINVESVIKDDTNSSSSGFAVLIPNPEEERVVVPRRKRRARQCSPVESYEEITEKRPRRASRYFEKFESDLKVKRSSRRTSRDYARESVLQSAIARKEKSFSSLNPPEDRPQRRSSRLTDEPKASSNKKAMMRTRSQTEIKVNGIKTPKGSEISDFDENSHEEFKLIPSRRGFRSLDPTKRTPRIAKENIPNDESFTKGGESEKENDRIYLQSDSEIKPKMEDSVRLYNEKENQQHPLSALQPRLCECESLTMMRPNNSSLQTSDMCRAIDSFDDKFYVCCTPIAPDTVLLRASKRTPFLQFCNSHIQRLFGHNACPSCGVFCTQGIFYVCVSKHIFHQDCSISKDIFTLCPHCGTDNFTLYKLRTENHKYPLFLPIQKPINRERMARITQQYNQTLYESQSIEQNILAGETLILPSGKKITAEGIPLPEKEALIELMKTPLYQNDVRYTYRSLYQAAKLGDVQRILSILATGMNPNRDAGCMCALHAAASAGHLLAVHVLIQAGANSDILDKSQNTPLTLAAFNHHNQVLKYLVKAGATLTLQGAEGMTALHLVSKFGNLEGCHILLSEANTPETFVNMVDDGRWTALVWAAENSHYEIARYLLEKRADPHVRDGEMNIALHWSAFSGSMEITEDLLNFGSNINLSNAHGDTPLHIAARQAADECVTVLLARGARADMMNKAGLTAKDCVIVPDSYCLAAIELNLKIHNIRSKLNIYPIILTNDVSRGREAVPIQCVNGIDQEGLPTNYTYVTENCFTSNITFDRTITSLDPCKCDDMCYSAGCMCGKISRRCWYDNKGKLSCDFNFQDPPMIFECSEACNCNILMCKNRVVQQGMKVRLQMIKTKDKSWGVISLGHIPRGTYVCEYVGEIISDCEADTREDDSYLFDLDNREGGESYCLDARKYGNITRFINHSCRPNLAPVRVFIGHRDLHFPRIAMFAARDIEPCEELGFDYGEKFWVIKGNSFTCQCKEEICRYSDKNIQQTLDKFNEKMEIEEMHA